MSTPGRISVILPNYNHAAHVGRALEAILTQSAPPYEVIVVDDCSTDNSLDVIEEIASRYPSVQVYRSDRNRGAAQASERALSKATGEYLYSAGSDDRVWPGLFEKSLALLERHPQAALCCADGAFYFPDEDRIEVERFGLSDAPCYFPPQEFARVIGRRREFSMASHTCILRRDALLAAGGYRPELRWHCDWFVEYALAFRHGICYVPEVLAEFRITSAAYSKGMNRRKEQAALQRQILATLDAEEYADVRPSFRNPAVFSRFGLSMLAILAGNPRHWHYLSPRLAANAFRWDWKRWTNREWRRIIYCGMPRPVRDLYQWSKRLRGARR